MQSLEELASRIGDRLHSELLHESAHLAPLSIGRFNLHLQR